MLSFLFAIVFNERNKIKILLRLKCVYDIMCFIRQASYHEFDISACRKVFIIGSLDIYKSAFLIHEYFACFNCNAIRSACVA